jgi:hypothetical protein
MEDLNKLKELCDKFNENNKTDDVEEADVFQDEINDDEMNRAYDALITSTDVEASDADELDKTREYEG